jgi:1-acyl-sn-glycerol-3-phosphate acyltransferase
MDFSRRLAFRALSFVATLWMWRNARVVARGLDRIPKKAPDEKRVYLIMNHTSTFDFVALLHMSKGPFTVLMDEGAFQAPVFGPLLKKAGFIPLVEGDSESGLRACVDAVNEGRPLIISLHKGSSVCGEWSRPRTGGLRIAHETGATIYPVFIMAESDRIRRSNIRGVDGSSNRFTVFKNALYFIQPLPPFDLSSLPAEPSYEDFFGIARTLEAKMNETRAYYDGFMDKYRERLAPLARWGGARFRVSW